MKSRKVRCMDHVSCMGNRARRNRWGNFLYRSAVTNIVTCRNFEVISNKFEVNRIYTPTYSCMVRCPPPEITTVCNIFTPNKLAQAITLREVPESNLGWGTDHSDWSFSCFFFQSLQANARIVPYIRSLPLSCASFPKHYSEAIQSECC
jgi:hypothetical protein